VDDRVHPAAGVDLVRNASRLDGAAEVTDHHAGRARCDVGERSRAFVGSRVQDDLMALVHELPRGGAAEAVRAAGDEDAGHC